jgi:tetratricopeptide (TPR) repeat protein
MSLQETMTMATTAFSSGDFESALAHFTKCTTLTENKSHLCTINTNKGAALQRLNRFAEAVEAFNLALDARPNYLQALFNNGVTLKALSRLEEALVMFDRALEQEKKYYPALCGKSEVLCQLDRYSEAIDSATIAIEIEPTTPTAYVDRAFAYLKNGNFKEAATDYKASNLVNAETTKLHAIALSNWATELDKAGKTKSALKQMLKAREMEKTEGRTFTCGLLHYSLAEYPESLALFEEVLETNPEHVDAIAAIGNIYIQEEKFDAALEKLKLADADIDRLTVMDKVSLIQNLGVAHLKTGDPVSAKETFERILKLDPDNAQAKLALHAVKNVESSSTSADIRVDTNGPKANPNVNLGDGGDDDEKEKVVEEKKAPPPVAQKPVPVAEEKVEPKKEVPAPEKAAPKKAAPKKAAPKKAAPVAPKAAAPIAVAAPTSSASSEGERPVHSLESLQSKPFPDGVVSTERELYLSNDVFNDLFKMSKDEWTKLPKWKRVTQKKKHKLF